MKRLVRANRSGFCDLVGKIIVPKISSAPSLFMVFTLFYFIYPVYGYNFNARTSNSEPVFNYIHF
jgi:hypothetical protein